MSDAVVTCFVIEPSGYQARWLRRYCAHDGMRCPLPAGYHDARVRIGDGPEHIVRDEADRPLHIESVRDLGDPAHPLRRDPRWPTLCACGYVFLASDQWQVHTETLYQSVTLGGLKTRTEWGPGAMYDAWWSPEEWRNPIDRLALTVLLPDGFEWNIDGPASHDGHLTPRAWTRTGVPPRVTARPSIQTPTWHGFLTDGILTAC